MWDQQSSFTLRNSEGIATYQLSRYSVNSPRDSKGRLVLRHNPHHRTEAKLLDMWSKRWVAWSGGIPYPQGSDHPLVEQGSLASPRNWDQGLYTQAYQKYVSTMRARAKAALGVTLASSRQSAQMVSSRYRGLVGFLTEVRSPRDAKRMLRNLRTRPRGVELRRTKISKGSSAYLEGIFGWAPLIEDVTSALDVLCTVPRAGFISTSASQYKDYESVEGWFPERIESTCSRVETCTIAGSVSITNPNAFLASQLGLVNPAQIAWDLVPFSFLVNMFSNMNSVIGSMTDFYGVAFDGGASITRSYSQKESVRVSRLKEWYESDKTPELLRTASVARKQKVREIVGSLPAPSLVFRVPELGLSEMAMLSALAVVQLTRVDQILKRL